MDALCEICDSADDVQQTGVKLMCCVECREFFGFETWVVDQQADEFADYRREQMYGKQL